MKGEGKKKTTLEAPNDDVVVGGVANTAAAAAVNVAIDLGVDGNGGHGDGDGDDPPLPAAPLVQKEHTEFQKEEGEKTRAEDSDEEEEEEEEEEEDKEDGSAVPKEGQGQMYGEGFYEVEAIRRKRFRKGQLQYFIKWRGWPEATNTWEPPENLESVPEIVQAFEESLKSGKHHKRKRKHVAHHTQLKKRQERSTTPYCLRRLSTSTADNHTQSAPLDDVSLTDLLAFPQTVIFANEVENNGDASSIGKDKQAIDNRVANASEQIVERNEENDYDPKLSELKAMTTNGYDADKLAIHFQEAKISNGNRHIDSQKNRVCMEPDQSGRCRGAKRRKSGSVKRFKKDSYAGEPVNTQRPISTSVDIGESEQTGNIDHASDNSQRNMDHAKPACNIVKIVKPIGYSAAVSSNMQDALVTFMAMRSDGTEVMVDNKYLKAYNPLLLISFYEQHLRYSLHLD